MRIWEVVERSPSGFASLRYTEEEHEDLHDQNLAIQQCREVQSNQKKRGVQEAAPCCTVELLPHILDDSDNLASGCRTCM